MGWLFAQAAGHDLTDTGRQWGGRGPTAFPTYGQCPVFFAGRGAQDGVLQLLKNTHPETSGLAGPWTAPGTPYEPGKVSRGGGDHGPSHSSKMPWGGLDEAEVTLDMRFGFSTCIVGGTLPVLAPLSNLGKVEKGCPGAPGVGPHHAYSTSEGLGWALTRTSPGVLPRPWSSGPPTSHPPQPVGEGQVTGVRTEAPPSPSLRTGQLCLPPPGGRGSGRRVRWPPS